MSKKPSNPKKETQEDFWDLGDDDLDLDKVTGEEEEAHESVEEDPEEEEAAKSADSTDESAGKEVEEKSEESEKTSKAKKKKELKIADPDDLGDLEEEEEEHIDGSTFKEGEPEPDLVRIRDSKPKKEIKVKEHIPLTILEKISIVAVLAILAGVAAWGITTFYRDAPQGKLVTFIEDFPAEGENVTISGVETWWRPPVRDGENADIGIVIDANLIPCARITLKDSGSTDLQISFRDGEQQLIGDTINLSIEGGKFSKTGSNEIIVNSTAGFTDSSRFNDYSNGDIPPWSVTISEAGEAGSDSDPLVKARVQAIYKEKK